MDRQLEAANALLNWMRASPAAKAAGARVHPLLCAARDEYGGLCLAVGASVDQSIRQDEGIAPDEELCAIPRSLMVEPSDVLLAPTQQPCTSAANSKEKNEQLLPAHLPRDKPHAALAAALLQRYYKLQEQQQHCPRQQQHNTLQQCSSGNAQLQHCTLSPSEQLEGPPQAYLDCLPTRTDLCAILPVLAHSLQQQQQQQQSPHKLPHQSLISLLLSPSPMASAALEAQLESLQSEWEALEALDLPHMPLLPDIEAYYQWARGLVWSRSIQLWGGPTLVPVIDLLNHAYPPNVRCQIYAEDVAGGGERASSSSPRSDQHEDDSSEPDSSCSSDVPGCCVVTRFGQDLEQHQRQERQLFCCHAIRRLPPGQQLLWHYSSHDFDAGWLACYGFIPVDGKSSRPSPGEAGPQGRACSHSAAIDKLEELLAKASEQDLRCQGMSRGLAGALHTLLLREQAAAGQTHDDAELPA